MEKLPEIRVSEGKLSNQAQERLQNVVNENDSQRQRVILISSNENNKLFAAQWLGKELGKEVYRIDLSLVISKYIGETEKNLSKIFDSAANKEWILFFDEADALFGKRTNVRDSHDKYANQETSYLMQLIENCQGLVILATLRKKFDTALAKEFKYIISLDDSN